jgi:hypothetical protein
MRPSFYIERLLIMTKRMMMTLLLGAFLIVGGSGGMEAPDAGQKKTIDHPTPDHPQSGDSQKENIETKVNALSMEHYHTPIDQIANDVVVLSIFSQLNPEELLDARLVSQKWRGIALKVMESKITGSIATKYKIKKEDYDTETKLLNLYKKYFLNPVLNASLTKMVPSEGTLTGIPYRIGSIINKDGIIDLAAFGDASNHMVITTSPTAFFADHGDKLVILIAPRALILNNLNDYTNPFVKLENTQWDQTTSPIGIFWRQGNSPNKYSYGYHVQMRDNGVESYRSCALFDIVTSPRASKSLGSLFDYAARKVRMAGSIYLQFDNLT